MNSKTISASPPYMSRWMDISGIGRELKEKKGENERERELLLGGRYKHDFYMRGYALQSESLYLEGS